MLFLLQVKFEFCLYILLCLKCKLNIFFLSVIKISAYFDHLFNLYKTQNVPHVSYVNTIMLWYRILLNYLRNLRLLVIINESKFVFKWNTNNTMLSEQFQSKIHRLILEIGKIDIPYTHIHDCSITWYSTCTLIKDGGAKLVLLPRSVAHLYQ
jgi:hypothetical protein